MKNDILGINSKYEILSDNGTWSDFKGIMKTTKDISYKLTFCNNEIVVCGEDHPFFIDNKQVPANQLLVGNTLDSNDQSIWTIGSIQLIQDTIVLYDVVGTSTGRYLIHNSLCTHNCDELAFVGRNIQEAFWRSISPTLSTGGSCIISSTPNGEGDKFANLWHGAEFGTNDFAPIYVAWDEPPGRDQKFKDETIAELGDLAWKQEFECLFLTSEALLIDALFLNNLDASVKQMVPIKQEMGTNWFDNINEEATYLMGVDPSTGTGNDYSVIQVFEFPTMVQVAEFRSNSVSTPQLYGIIKYILKLMEKQRALCYFSVENNGVGEGVIALYQNDESPSESAQFISEEGKNRMGMTTTTRTKLKACLSLKTLIETSKMKIKSALLLKEMKTYAIHGGSYAALPGATDDCVAACLIIVRLLKEIASYEQSAYDKLYVYSEEETKFSDDDPMEEPMGMIF